MYKDFEVNEDIVTCNTVEEEQCTVDEGGAEWCVQVPRQVCTKETQPVVKTSPKSECRTVKKTVCGKESCPMVNKGRKCNNVTKAVREKREIEHFRMVETF